MPNRNKLGQYWTPEHIVDAMLALRRNRGSVLEPSSGTGRFLRRMPEAIGVEIDGAVVPSDLLPRTTIANFFDFPASEQFDTVIGNPPYVAGRGLPPGWSGVWTPRLPATANLYLHFIDKCLDHVKPGGELVFIVPSGFLSSASMGSRLRSRMCREGAFTHVVRRGELADWSGAAIHTTVFRWERGAGQSQVATDDGPRHLTERDGFLWLTKFKPAGFLGALFRATVGAVPTAKALRDGPTAEHRAIYIHYGKPIPVDVSDMVSWPRSRTTSDEPKIFFLGGPTRRPAKFHYGASPRHIDHALLPKIGIDCRRAASALNIWFAAHGAELGLEIAGRWSAGVRQLERCPIDAALRFELIGYQSP